MGTKAAPIIANLVMGVFENTHVYTYHLQPLLWIRFIDDIFMLWPHGKESLLEFVQHLNSVHHSLKFTCESSESSLPMLDSMIIKDQSGKLYTTLYSKSTETHSYLHFASCHLHNQKTGGLFSQLLRVKRICAKDTDFEIHSHNRLSHYKRINYPEQLLQDDLDKIKLIPRCQLLTINEEPETPNESPLVYVSTYHPQNPPVKDILKKNWPTLLIDSKLQCVSDRRVVFDHNRLKKSTWHPGQLRNLLSPPKMGIHNPNRWSISQTSAKTPNADTVQNWTSVERSEAPPLARPTL